MPKIKKFLKKFTVLFLLILMTLPTFWRMAKPGIFSMQDFHFFRFFEFDQCIQRREIPCRWSFNAGMGYGEPLFNFYGQISYALGEIFHLAGWGLIDSLKMVFALSFVVSGISMFYLGKSIWKNNWAAFLSAAIYLYAPYRAVDVWVRGALPEALGFAIAPLVILAIKKNNGFGFAFSLALLILTHNLSLILFFPVIISFMVYHRFYKGIWGGILALGISSFYLLPVIFESQYITLWKTTVDYFDFHGHFAGLYQLLISRYWGYGASLFGNDDRLSLAVGLVQWLLPILILVVALFKKIKLNKEFILLTFLGWFCLFLTHNKSTFIWDLITPMKYLQFPWRFIGPAVFCFAAASSYLLEFFGNKAKIFLLIFFLTFFLNVGFFREDQWLNVNENYFLTGEIWDLQRQASINDYWPDFGHSLPQKFSDGKMINYFPGWNKTPDANGLIPAEGAVFSDTPSRRIGNLISLASLGLSIFLVVGERKIWQKK